MRLAGGLLPRVLLTITGTYYDGSTTHGFLRAGDSSFTTIDLPASMYTIPVGINPQGRSRDTTLTQAS